MQKMSKWEKGDGWKIQAYPGLLDLVVVLEVQLEVGEELDGLGLGLVQAHTVH